MTRSGRLPLAGLRVVDSTDERGELCARLLADLGADVVRTEPPGGSSSRRLPPYGPDGTSLSFAVRNTNKRCVTLDVTDADGHQLLDELLESADVWIEGHRPGALAAAGRSHAEITMRHPHLVVTSITDFGLTGPYRDYVATDDVLIGMGGMLFRSGTPDRPPLLPPGSLAYDVGSIAAAVATLAAVWQRGQTRRGQHLDVSVLHALSQITDWSLPNWSATTEAGRSYSQVRAGSGFVYPLYPCGDGYVRLVVLSTRQWRALRAWLGEPEVLQDEHWDHILSRMSIQADVLDPMYVELFSKYTAAELADEAQRRGIVMTPVLEPREVLTAPHFVERRTFTDAEFAPGVSGSVTTGFFESGDEHLGYRRRAPEVGEHTAEVLDELRSMSPPVDVGQPVDPAPPFAGLKVLDFGHGGVGVEGGRLLAELGADVVKIESSTYPDFMRTVQGGPISASFASSSRLKRSIDVNLKHERGREIVERLVGWADVVIENNSTGTMDALGFGYERLRQLNPRIVMVSSQLMGSSGPWKDWIGYGPSTRPVGGMTHLWNFPDREMPPGSGAIHPDHVAGRLVALAAIAALIGRSNVDGDGAHLEVAQVDTVIGLLADLYLQESLSPGSVQPTGNDSERGAPWGVYRCDGDERWCVITIRSDEDWRRFRDAMGDPDWARRPGLDTVDGRRAAGLTIDEHITEWTRTRSDKDVTAALQSFGVPAGFMAYPPDMATDAHYQARAYPQPVDQPALGRIVLEGPSFVSTGMPPAVAGPAPLLGEHTREICRQILGMLDDEIDTHMAAGVLNEQAVQSSSESLSESVK